MNVNLCSIIAIIECDYTINTHTYTQRKGDSYETNDFMIMMMQTGVKIFVLGTLTNHICTQKKNEGKEKETMKKKNAYKLNDIFLVIAVSNQITTTNSKEKKNHSLIIKAHLREKNN